MPIDRKTKIVATVGPATESEKQLQQLVTAGANYFRFNQKYSPPSWHNREIALIRKIGKKQKKELGIIIDIPSYDFDIELNDWDYVALSYLKTPNEVVRLRQRLVKKGKSSKIVAKIENQTAMDNLERIAEVSDGVMVARGDLGKETPIEELAFFQKRIVDVCRQKSKPVIVATEMLYSMIDNPKPTRAEATDVANAVFDGTDAIMLSEETALGKYPIDAVKVMNKIARFCENTSELRSFDPRNISLKDHLIGSAAAICQKASEVKIIIVFTKTGNSARELSRYRLGIPIIAVCDSNMTARELALSYGVIPLVVNFRNTRYGESGAVFEIIKKKGWCQLGETALVIHGTNWLEEGSANSLSFRKIL